MQLGGDGMENRSRNTALLFIAAGLFLILGNLIGFYTVAALIIIWFGIFKLKNREKSIGYALLAVGGVILLSDQLFLVIGVVLISLGYYFMRSKQANGSDFYVQKQKILESLKHNQRLWELKSFSVWSLIAEIKLDLSLAVIDEKETTVMLQGIIGDIDIIVPEDIGVSVKSAVIIGENHAGPETEEGIVNKIMWQSANFADSEYRVNFVISYIVGNVDIKVL
jgi:lia operon protein LiaF